MTTSPPFRIRRGPYARIFVADPYWFIPRLALRLRGYRRTHFYSFTKPNAAQRALESA